MEMCGVRRKKTFFYSRRSGVRVLPQRLESGRARVPRSHLFFPWLVTHHTYKWTVYIHGATNEYISIATKRLVFELHPSLNIPIRIVDSAPFELSEIGWGEFQIKRAIVFHSDVAKKQLEMYVNSMQLMITKYTFIFIPDTDSVISQISIFRNQMNFLLISRYHELKLHHEDRSGPPTTKKSVVVESYDEIVFTDPSEAFYLRAHDHPVVVVSESSSGLSLTPPSGIVNDNFSEKKRGDTKDIP